MLYEINALRYNYYYHLNVYVYSRVCALTISKTDRGKKDKIERRKLK